MGKPGGAGYCGGWVGGGAGRDGGCAWVAESGGKSAVPGPSGERWYPVPVLFTDRRAVGTRRLVGTLPPLIIQVSIMSNKT